MAQQVRVVGSRQWVAATMAVCQCHQCCWWLTHLQIHTHTHILDGLSFPCLYVCLRAISLLCFYSWGLPALECLFVFVCKYVYVCVCGCVCVRAWPLQHMLQLRQVHHSATNWFLLVFCVIWDKLSHIHISREVRVVESI